jgi:hypothetical protein
MLDSHLDALYEDVQELAKRKQDAILTKTRIAMINRLLSQMLELMEGEPNVPFLDTLDEATLPQNADGLIVLGQYKSAMAQFRGKYANDFDIF